jgi:hypothetical protein
VRSTEVVVKAASPRSGSRTTARRAPESTTRWRSTFFAVNAENRCSEDSVDVSARRLAIVRAAHCGAVWRSSPRFPLHRERSRSGHEGPVRKIGPSPSLVNRASTDSCARHGSSCACRRSSGHATTLIPSLRASARRRPFPDEVAPCAFMMVFSGRPHAETLAVQCPRGAERFLHEHTACDQAMIIRSTRREVTFVRTKWGVSDPRRSGPETASGGWQRGSLTPHTSSSLNRAA